MRRRTRKFIGAVAMLTFVIIYALIAVAVAQASLPGTSRLTQLIYYLVVGLGWTLPLLPLIRWMERPDPDEA
jgi:hypothetical protein